ncbi:MAG: exodeoxyribonuclease V subunit gamma [Candidatus Methylumidiphilus sp.]
MLHLFQSNRLETLLELLAAIVAYPQGNALAKETIVVQSKGMGRWITLKLAAKHGICANIQFPLPASYQWELLRTVLGELPLRSAFSPEAIAFRLMDWLSKPHNLERVPTLANYLSGGEDIRRYELAVRIADLFDQYLVYRPDWIAAWERGEMLGLGADEHWQALLWCELVATVKEPHRTRLIERLLQAIESGEVEGRLPDRVLLFGISSLPPVFLNVVQALSKHCYVALFALNPCRQPWGEIHDSLEIAKLAGENDPSDLYLEEGNPLLASLGKQGREFFDSLLHESPDIVELFEDQNMGDSLLHVLQADILNLVDRSPLRFSEAVENGGQHPRQLIARDDRSLQIHACHSPMREVEVLRDQLLAMLDGDPALNPADIAVLTPDIALYSPYIDAVFGAAESATRIPFGIADRGETGEQAFHETFLRLLDLPSSRFDAEWVMDFLEQPFLRNRFGLCEDDLPAIHQTVRETGIRWGRDADHRAALGLPAESRHTWREGLQRMLLGYALPQAVAEDGIPLFDETLPFDDVEGGLAQVIGRFAEFVEVLMQYSSGLKPSRPLVAWIDQLADLLENLFSPSTEDEENSRQRLRDAFELLGELAELSTFGSPVDLMVVKRWLTNQLNTKSGGGFLTGGVTFCAMVPMRSLPFKVICLLGLNDDAFPRRQHPKGFDLIARHPRRGDRSRRLDDRYLFLETLLSARDILYISHVGRNIRDNGVLPPSVLVADILDVVQSGFAMQDGGDCLDHILTTHSLQGFNPAYFKGDPKLPGFSTHWLVAANSLGKQSENTVGFFAKPLPEPEENPLVVDLDGLAFFFSNPSRYLLRNRLGLSLNVGEEAFENREPFALDYFGKEAMRKMALDELHRNFPAHTAQRLAAAAGTLPHGGFGQAIFAKEQAVAKKAAPILLPLMDIPKLEPFFLQFESASIRLESALRGVTAQGLVEWRLHAISPRDLLNLWIRHLALCLLQPPNVLCESRLVGEKKTFRLSPVGNPGLELAKLLGYFRQGLCRPLPFFVKSACAYAKNGAAENREKALKEAHKVWDVPAYRNGAFFGESENSYYQMVYRGGDPLDDEFESLSLDIFPSLMAVLEEEV